MASLAQIIAQLKAFPHYKTVEQSATWNNLLLQISFSKAEIVFENNANLSDPPSYGSMGVNISLKSNPASFTSILDLASLKYETISKFQIGVLLDQGRISSLAAEKGAIKAHVAIQTFVHEFALHVLPFAEIIKKVKDDYSLNQLISEINNQKVAGLNTLAHSGVFKPAHVYNKILNEIILKMHINFNVTHTMWIKTLTTFEISERRAWHFNPGQLAPGYLDDIVLAVDTPANRFIEYLNEDDKANWTAMDPGLRSEVFIERKKFYFSAPWNPATPGEERAYLWDAQVESRISRMYKRWQEGP